MDDVCSLRLSDFDRYEVVEGDQDNQRYDTDAQTPTDQFLFDRQQRLNGGVLFGLQIDFRHKT